MLSQSKQNFYLLTLFKIATVIHILCLIANLIIYPYIISHEILNIVIDYSLLISALCISMIITIKTIQFFIQSHHDFIQHYKTLGFMTESCIVTATGLVLFFNQEITGRFILFIAHLSKQVHSNKIYVLIVLLTLLFCIELYEAQKINRQSIDRKSILKIIVFHIVTLITKLCIIFGTTIGFIHPIINILNLKQFQEFDSLIFQLTTTQFFLYIHTIIIILFGLWISIGIYYIYKFYRKYRK